MEKLVLIDGNSLINRAFYAMPLLVTKNGTPTNAVYGFMNMFFKMVSDVKPTYVAVAFDLKAPTFRHKMYPEYKGTRKPMPEELRPQIPMLKEVLTMMGIKVIEKEGVEADDIIGTVAKHTKIQTLIYTGDKDALQLVDEETSVYFTKRGITDIDVYSAENFTEKTGITPAQIIELKALMGDSSDNIPGIKGVGEKTAVDLVQRYGGIDGLYAHTDELKGKLQEKVVLCKDTAYLSRKLATIDTDCGVDTDVSGMTFKLPLSQAVKRKFAELEFKSLAARTELFEADAFTVVAETVEKEITVVEVEDLSLLENVRAERLATIVISEKRAAFFDGDQTEYDIKIRATLFDEGFLLADVLKALKSWFVGDTRLILFNKKDLKHFLRDCAGIELTAPCDDLSIVKYLADFAGRDESLEEVLLEYGKENSPPAYAVYALYENLFEKLKAEGMEKLYKEIELPLADVLFDMETAGFKIDVSALSETGEKYAAMLAETENKIRELAGEETLNINSPKQLGGVLFDKLKLGKGKKNKHGYSTTAEVLEAIEDAHPIVPLILRYRQIAKLYSTYIEGFKPLINKRTGLIHTSFNQTVTATGRLSSKEPNLQNIPVRDDEGRELRKFFVPRADDRVLVGADYSQIELRLLAAFSGCGALIDAFNNGRDVHAETAARVFGIPMEEVTPQMRRSAKAVNFGIIYGISEYGLAKNLKISNAQAREYIDNYFKQYPEVKKYMDDNVLFAKTNGYAVTLFGRKRYIRELLSSSYNMRQFGERVAMNMPLQGSSADIIKVAMINVSERLKAENLKSELVLQVHDELIVDAFVDEKQQVEKILKEEMENAVELDVALTVEIGSGRTWYDAK